jgi:hypothetical protein
MPLSIFFLSEFLFHFHADASRFSGLSLDAAFQENRIKGKQQSGI